MAWRIYVELEMAVRSEERYMAGKGLVLRCGLTGGGVNDAGAGHRNMSALSKGQGGREYNEITKGCGCTEETV
jgi:hypothetical protein